VNRQTKRLLQRQGQLAADGTPVADRPTAPPTTVRPAEVERRPLPERAASYLSEVRGELAKVLWPRRAEVVNYSAVVLTTLVLLALLIFGLNYAFARGVIFLFK
jgi:preprotein translocase subunit SecE